MSMSVTNILLKIMAVLLAVLLWFHVVSKKQYEYDVTLPVTQYDLPPGIGPVSGFPDSLTVRVLADGKRLMRDDWKKAGLKVKGTRLRRGVNSLDLNLETVSLARADNVTLQEIPGAGTITVQLDRLDTLDAPIAARITVAPERGAAYITGGVKLTPNKARVIGPASLLDRIDSIYTEPMVMQNGDSVHSLYLKLQRPAEVGIHLQADSILAKVSFERAVTRRYEPLPVTIGRNAAGGEAAFEPDRVAVDLRCPEALSDTLSGAAIQVRVNNDGGIRDGYLKVEVTFPRQCTLIRVVPDSVRVHMIP